MLRQVQPQRPALQHALHSLSHFGPQMMNETLGAGKAEALLSMSPTQAKKPPREPKVLVPAGVREIAWPAMRVVRVRGNA
jgi:hypothetical protein